MYKIIISIFLSLCSGFHLQAEPLQLTDEELASPPPRIIRTCCSFGSDLRLMIIPMIKITDISSPDLLGPHQYLGHKSEGNGIIYTRRGGFIDMGHLRDQADWTAYLHALIRKNRTSGAVQFKLGNEGGTKSLHINIPSTFSAADEIVLAGKIAYDLSVWHEIATYFGASTVPMVPERYSSFSVEDAYSNLLGVRLGMQALSSDLPYEEAMSLLIAEALENLAAVDTEIETYAAMEDVHNLWWTRDKRLPSRRVLLVHQVNVYDTAMPWLVPGWGDDVLTPELLEVPNYTSTKELLTDFYQLNFRLNLKFPFRKMYPNRTRRFITQADFNNILDFIAEDMKFRALVDAQKLEAVEKRKAAREKRRATRLE